MKKNVISFILLLLLTSCFNSVHNQDGAKNNNRFTFYHCNQTLGAKFIEGNCNRIDHKPLYQTSSNPLIYHRECSECPNTSFMISNDSLIFNIAIDSLSELEFKKYYKKYSSELGAPREEESSNGYSLTWQLRNEDIMIKLFKTKDAVRNNNFNYRLRIDDINSAGFR